MISKYAHKELNWVDLESPQKEEILHVLEEYFIPEDIKNDIIQGYKKDKVHINNDFIYASILGKIICFVNDDLLLTIHEEPIEAFSKFSKEVELDITSSEKINSHKTMFAYLLKNLYIDSRNELSDNYSFIEKLKNELLVINKYKKKVKILTYIISILIILLIIFIWL